MENGKNSGFANNVGRAVELMNRAHEKNINALNGQKEELQGYVHTQNGAKSPLRKMNHDLFKTIYFDKNYIRKRTWGMLVMIAVLILVALADWPLNKTGLLPLHLSKSATNWLALGIGVLFALDAYGAAHLIKRGKLEGNYTNLLVGMVLLILAVVGAYVVANSRTEYMHVMNPKLAVSTVAWTFLSLFFYFIGFVATYIYESNVTNLALLDSFETELKTYKRATKDIKNIDKQINTLNKKHITDVLKQTKEDIATSNNEQSFSHQAEEFESSQNSTAKNN